MKEKVKQLGPALLEAFQKVPDPRSPLGRRHPLPAILSLAVCSMLCNCHSLYAIYQWGREHAELAPLLGFKGTKTPATSTLHEVFKRLDREAFEAALREWAQGELGGRSEAVAIDGKSLRGIHGEELPGVHLVAAYGQQLGLVLAQKGGRGAGGGTDRSSGTVGASGTGRASGNRGRPLRPAESEPAGGGTRRRLLLGSEG